VTAIQYVDEVTRESVEQLFVVGVMYTEEEKAAHDQRAEAILQF